MIFIPPSILFIITRPFFQYRAGNESDQNGWFPKRNRRLSRASSKVSSGLGDAQHTAAGSQEFPVLKFGSGMIDDSHAAFAVFI